MPELKATLEASHAVGTGLDEVQIAVMRKFGDDDECDDLDETLALFNRVCERGRRRRTVVAQSSAAAL
jgi:hypothetical protein